jgi:hypothetical protein
VPPTLSAGGGIPRAAPLRALEYVIAAGIGASDRREAGVCIAASGCTWLTDPMQLPVRASSLVVSALSERPTLLHQKEPTLAAMVAVCSPWRHESVAWPVDCSHEQCLLAPCQQHCSVLVVCTMFCFDAFPASTSCACASAL